MSRKVHQFENVNQMITVLHKGGPANDYGSTDYQNKYRQDNVNVVWPEVPGAQRMSHSDVQAYLLRVLFGKYSY